MHVGRRVDYAIRALAYLAAQPPDKVVSKTIIEKNMGGLLTARNTHNGAEFKIVV